MKKYLKVSLKQLKQELSKVAKKAAQGVRIDITRYNKPFLTLIKADESKCLVGSKVDSFSIKSIDLIGAKNSKGSILDLLQADREGGL
jgi:antitoxin (DNA-binding transcriptional repressor) of toxin-antitoxin stability system